MCVQENRMKKAVQVMADTINTLRTGRANPAILDRIVVGVLACSPCPRCFVVPSPVLF